MLVRFGFVAMSVELENASPSKTVTYKTYQQLAARDQPAALEKVRRVAGQNLANSLRLLRYCLAHSVKVYRFSSKIIPLATHPELAHWDYLDELKPQLALLGILIKSNDLRVTFHPDHYTLLNSLSEKVFAASVADLLHHSRLLGAMGLDERAKLIIHVGGGYRDKTGSLERFVKNWARLPGEIAGRLTLENDDRTFTACQTLSLCEKLRLPMVLDIHHFRCNHEEGSRLEDLYARFTSTWSGSGLPPKIHVSSPRSNGDLRSHHDYVSPDDLYNFLMFAREHKINLDVMVEAKQKDRAMFRLVRELGRLRGIRPVSDAALEIE